MNVGPDLSLHQENQASMVGEKGISGGMTEGRNPDLRSSSEITFSTRVLKKLADGVERVGMKLAEDGIGSRSRQERPSAGDGGKDRWERRECTMDSTDRRTSNTSKKKREQ